jgi:hypothetical protein
VSYRESYYARPGLSSDYWRWMEENIYKSRHRVMGVDMVNAIVFIGFFVGLAFLMSLWSLTFDNKDRN